MAQRGCGEAALRVLRRFESCPLHHYFVGAILNRVVSEFRLCQVVHRSNGSEGDNSDFMNNALKVQLMASLFEGLV